MGSSAAPAARRVLAGISDKKVICEPGRTGTMQVPGQKQRIWTITYTGQTNSENGR